MRLFPPPEQSRPLSSLCWRCAQVFNPGRRISGRGWPRTVQLDEETLGTLFYDLDEEQEGGPGVFFVRTPISALG